MLKIQEFLISTNGDFAQLEEKYAISHKRHSKYNNLVLFKYNQIDSPFSEEIVRECRGIILNSSNNWEIVSRSFDKFFNYSEGHAPKIDWKKARCFEKIDGSLAVFYNYDNKWHVQTTGTPDASGNVNDFGMTFADLFWKTFNDLAELPDINSSAQDLCFLFELTSQYNRIVVVHKFPHLTLLGARNRITQEEMSANEAIKYFNIKTNTPYGAILSPVKEFSLQSIEDIEKSFETISPLSQEGYVVFDGVNRIKCKTPSYIAIHHMKDGLSRKAFVEIARKGEITEVLAYFPEFKPMMDDITQKLTNLISELENNYEQIKHIESQKEFAIEAVKTKCSSALFQLRAGKVKSIKEHLANINIDNVMKLLDN